LALFSGRRLVIDFCVGGEQELRDNTPLVIVAHLASICCRQHLRAALRADNFLSCHLSRKLDRRHSHVHVVVDIFFLSSLVRWYGFAFELRHGSR